MAHVGSFSNFIFVFVFVFVTGASVDSTSCELTVDPDFSCPQTNNGIPKGPRGPKKIGTT